MNFKARINESTVGIIAKPGVAIDSKDDPKIVHIIHLLLTVFILFSPLFNI